MKQRTILLFLGALFLLLVGLTWNQARALDNDAPRASSMAGTAGPTGDQPAGVLDTPSGVVQVYLPTITAGLEMRQQGIWISREQIAQLPTSGPAWQQLLDAANEPTDEPDLSDQDEAANTLILAKAFVYARTGESRYLDEVIEALRVVTFNNTEEGGRTLALGRKLVAYVVSADLVDLAHADPELDIAFRLKLRELLTKNLEGRSLVSTHEERPNNWGTNAGASRAAVAVYLGDEVELARTAEVFKGWLGDRTSYDGFKFQTGSQGADTWSPLDEDELIAINPSGATIDGHSVDGALIDDISRGGPFQWPPVYTIYPWEGLQGAVVQAEILYRAGYPTWEWEDQALRRSVQFLYDIDWLPTGDDDEWIVWLVNYHYGTTFDVPLPARSGKNFGWTDWTHGEGRDS